MQKESYRKLLSFAKNSLVIFYSRRMTASSRKASSLVGASEEEGVVGRQILRLRLFSLASSDFAAAEPTSSSGVLVVGVWFKNHLQSVGFGCFVLHTTPTSLFPSLTKKYGVTFTHLF